MARSVSLPNLDYLRKKDVRLYETLRVIQENLIPGSQPSPPPVTGISVVSNGNGGFDIVLSDAGDVQREVNYFVEHDTSPDFQRARVEDLGASRSTVLQLGSGTFYFRAYSQYRFPPSPPSSPVVFGGSSPTGVRGGGTQTAPLQASTGSGSAPTNGQLGGSGFGKYTVRTQ